MNLYLKFNCLSKYKPHAHVHHLSSAKYLIITFIIITMKIIIRHGTNDSKVLIFHSAILRSRWYHPQNTQSDSSPQLLADFAELQLQSSKISYRFRNFKSFPSSFPLNSRALTRTQTHVARPEFRWLAQRYVPTYTCFHTR